MKDISTTQKDPKISPSNSKKISWASACVLVTFLVGVTSGTCYLTGWNFPVTLAAITASLIALRQIQA